MGEAEVGEEVGGGVVGTMGRHMRRLNRIVEMAQLGRKHTEPREYTEGREYTEVRELSPDLTGC